MFAVFLRRSRASRIIVIVKSNDKDNEGEQDGNGEDGKQEGWKKKLGISAEPVRKEFPSQ